MQMSLDQAINYLNKECGVYGISGVSSDFRDLLAAMESGNERAKTAIDVFCYRITKFIGAYAAAMGGVDAILFTAGIGENNGFIREKCVENLGFLGAELDKASNDTRGKELRISTDASKVDIWVVPTNEELAIANETFGICKGKGYCK
jgi:acetate kinase